jgi:murein DD-endopeptidase MepM/ murein hydrolase activator NlpD
MPERKKEFRDLKRRNQWVKNPIQSLKKAGKRKINSRFSTQTSVLLSCLMATINFMKILSQLQHFFFLCLLFSILTACKSGPFNLIKPSSPHEQYERKLINSGLNQTVIGAAWLSNGTESLQKPLEIKLPYQEKGYFSAEKVVATAFRFQLLKGQKLNVQLDKKAANNAMIYLDLWQPENGRPKFLAAADTLTHNLTFEADQTGEYLLRLQPELLGSSEYTLAITTGPSLQYPLKTFNRNQIQSLYGVGRDENTRKHEGVDIFAPFRTPVIAAAPGTVTRVNTNNLGGKVVWLRPDGKDYTLYYAHLDEQIATEGQRVVPGDTLGRMGNTGNARTTPPHLHFGIYTNNGAVDPLPFINPLVPELPKVNSPVAMLNTTMRTSSSVSLNGQLLKIGTIINVDAAVGISYRVVLPNGEMGYLPAKSVTATTKPLAKRLLKNQQTVFDQPDRLALVKQTLQAGETITLLGNFGDYQLMLDEDNQTGWIKNN